MKVQITRKQRRLGWPLCHNMLRQPEMVKHCMFHSLLQAPHPLNQHSPQAPEPPSPNINPNTATAPTVAALQAPEPPRLRAVYLTEETVKPQIPPWSRRPPPSPPQSSQAKELSSRTNFQTPGAAIAALKL